MKKITRLKSIRDKTYHATKQLSCQAIYQFSDFIINKKENILVNPSIQGSGIYRYVYLYILYILLTHYQGSLSMPEG